MNRTITYAGIFSCMVLLINLGCKKDKAKTVTNEAPVASNVAITGNNQVNSVLTVTYTYSDAEGDAESGTAFQWYIANDATGGGETAISGAIESEYTIEESQLGKYIRVGVTPKASAGTITGAEVKSVFTDAIGEQSTVTFTYNGQEVTYGVIKSGTTGKKWLDRNLGAGNAPNAVDDYANYGDLFQWGRLADGHQLITRTGLNDADAIGINGTTSLVEPYERSASDNPGHSKFIIVTSSATTGAEFDWRNPQNNNLWQGVDGINNPCPSGWHVPTKEEWSAENIVDLTDGFTKLKLTFTGIKNLATDEFFQSATSGVYWTSTVAEFSNTPGEMTESYRIRIQASTYQETAYPRAGGLAVRCIKD